MILFKIAVVWIVVAVILITLAVLAARKEQKLIDALPPDDREKFLTWKEQRPNHFGTWEEYQNEMALAQSLSLTDEKPMSYSQFVLSRRNQDLSLKESTGAAFLGLVCEAGEAGDVIKKHLYQGQPLNKEKAIEELGDVRFYLEWCCQMLGTTISELEKANVRKLEKRYATGFVPNVKRDAE